MNRPSEPQLMLAIILFAVFAFLMQGRAHGAGPYKVEVSTAEYLEGTVYWFDVGPFSMKAPMSSAGRKEVRLLNEFIQKFRPGSDIRLVEDGKEEEVKKGGWQRIPFRWDGRWQIWIKTEKRIRRAA